MTNPNPETQGKKRRGCLFYGCLSLVILAIIVGVGAFLVYRMAMGKLAEFAEKYTDTQPIELPAVDISDRDYESLQERVAKFGEALRDGKAGESLRLTSKELNALLARNPGFSSWGGRAHISLEEAGKVQGQLSLPLDKLAQASPMFHRLAGRYVNGTAVFAVGMENGQPSVRIQSLEVKGQALPQELVGPLSAQNWLQELSKNDPQTAEVLSKVGSLGVEGNRLVVESKGTSE